MTADRILNASGVYAAVLLPWLVRLTERGIDPILALHDADTIVRGIDQSWPKWSWRLKGIFARYAVRHRLLERGGDASIADVHKLVEIAMESARLSQPLAGPDAEEASCSRSSWQ